MKNSLNSKIWSKDDLCALKICYESRVPLKLMAQFFHRTESAITKMLTRTNIRPVGAYSRGKRPSSLQCKYKSIAELSALIQKTRERPSFKLDNPATVYYLTRQKARMQPALKHHRARVSSLEAWTSLTHLIAELKNTGKVINPIDNPSLLRQGYVYIMNGDPQKSADLLRIANTERRAQQLPRLFIEGITDNI